MFQTEEYDNVKINLSSLGEFKYPFAVFFNDGAMMLLWALSAEDIATWTTALREVSLNCGQ